MYSKLDDAQYFAIDLPSQSKLKPLIDLSFSQFLSQPSPEPSDAMRIGSVVHDVILNRTPLADIQVFEKLDGRSAEGKKQKKDLQDLKLYLFQSEVGMIEKIKSNFQSSPEAMFLLDRAQFIEQFAVASVSNHLGESFEMKMKPDIVHDSCIVDLKTIGMNVTPESVRKTMWSRKYGYQLATYLHLDFLVTRTQKNTAAIIWVETVPPYGTYVMPLKVSTLSTGFEQFKIVRDKYLEGINRPENNSPNAHGFFEDPT